MHTKAMKAMWTSVAAAVPITAFFLCMGLSGGCSTMKSILGEGESAPAGSYPDAATTGGQPARPTECSTTDNGLREATICWGVPPDSPDAYRIERAESADGPFETVGSVPPKKLRYLDMGTPEAPLKDSAAYYYRIIGVSSKGVESTPSQVLKTTTAPAPLPPVDAFADAPSSRAAAVYWSPAPCQGVGTYRVERTPSDTPTNFQGVGVSRTTNYVDGGTAASDLRDSTKYRYRVVSINRVGSASAPSKAAEMTTLPPPAVVRDLIAVSDEVRCVPLSWAASPEPDIVRYDVYRSAVAGGPFERIGAVDGRSSTNYLDGGANPGNLEDEGTYFYRVRAANAVTSESADPAAVKATTRAVPPEIQNVTAIASCPREVPISWPEAADRTVIGYEIWRADEESTDWMQIARLAGLQTTNFTDRGGAKGASGLGDLKDGTAYRYRIVAFNTANVRSSASAPISARTKFCPKAPAQLDATTNLPHIIQIAWRPNEEKDIADYLIQTSEDRATSFHKLSVVPGAASGPLSVKDSDLPSGDVRFYRIKALDADGLESEWSPVVRGQAKPIPQAPVGLATQRIADRLRLSWQPPAQKDVRKYGLWAKHLLSWELIGTTEQTEHIFDSSELASPLTVAVTAIDQDQLESAKSTPIEVRLDGNTK